MNPKQTAPILITLAPALATIAPPLLLCGAIILTLKWLCSDDEKQPPASPQPKPITEAPRKPAASAGFWPVAAEIPAKPANIPASIPARPAPRVVVPPVAAIPPAPKIQPRVPAPVAIPVVAPLVPPPLPLKKKLVTREDLAGVFNRGAQSLTRSAAVADLKKLGFGKSAAYDALTPDGRFADWLRHAPDGIITWIDGHSM